MVAEMKETNLFRKKKMNNGGCNLQELISIIEANLGTVEHGTSIGSENNLAKKIGWEDAKCVGRSERGGLPRQANSSHNQSSLGSCF